MMSAGSSAAVSTGVKASAPRSSRLQNSWSPMSPSGSVTMIAWSSGRRSRISRTLATLAPSVTTIFAPELPSRQASASGPNWVKSGTAIAPMR